MKAGTLVVWICPEHHPCMTGFLAPLASTVRFCRHVTGFDGEGETYCGAQMEVCYDERPKAIGPLSEGAADDERRLRVARVLQEAQKSLLDPYISAAEIVKVMGEGLKGIRKR